MVFSLLLFSKIVVALDVTYLVQIGVVFVYFKGDKFIIAKNNLLSFSISITNFQNGQKADFRT